jgi:hypothetical protein
MRVAGMATRITGYGTQSIQLLGITYIVGQSPGTIECGWSQIIGTTGHHIARCITDSTANALNTRIG